MTASVHLVGVDWPSVVAAFLAASPAWREPAREPARRSLGAWLPAVLVGLTALIAAAPPIAIALSVRRAEAEFRTQCRASGGHVALVQRARAPHNCVPD